MVYRNTMDLARLAQPAAGRCGRCGGPAPYHVIGCLDKPPIPDPAQAMHDAAMMVAGAAANNGMPGTAQILRDACERWRASRTTRQPTADVDMRDVMEAG